MPTEPRSEVKLVNDNITNGESDAGSTATEISSSSAKPEQEAGEQQPKLEPTLNNVTTNMADSSGTYHLRESTWCLRCDSLELLLTQAPFSSVASVSDKTFATSEQDDNSKAPAISDHSDQPTVPKIDVRARSSGKQVSGDNTSKKGALNNGESGHRPGEIFRLGEEKSQANRRNEADHPPARVHPKAQPPPVVSSSRYQIPPSFQPVGRPLGMVVNGDMHQGPRPPVPNALPMHQPHPSTGSVHFGAFHDSSSSSPAPLSGGIAPPPGMSMPDGRTHYMAHSGNGFPPMMPYGAEMVPTTFDTYGRPPAAYGPIDSYPPFGNNYGLPTPHSFHDAHPDDKNMYGQHPSGPTRSGVAGIGDDSSNSQRRMFEGPDYPGMIPNAGPLPQVVDEAEGLIGHLQQQFNSLEFADCVLELRHSDERATPVRIPGHRMLFSRSTEVASATAKQLARHNPNVPSLPTIHLKTTSKWIRPDSFYIAVQRLYGLPLLPIPPHPDSIKQGDVMDAGSVVERFDFALSYAAAGQFIRWDSVVNRGCQIAARLLNWQTIERALAFVLEEHRDQSSHDTYKYGEGSRVILESAVAFIANNLPTDFVLESSVQRPERYARLPSVSASVATPVSDKSPSPPIARGTSVHLGRGRRSQQLTGIQFGDLLSSEGKVSPAIDASRGQQQTRSPLNALISRVLLNLPFSSLKALFESLISGQTNAYLNVGLAYRTVQDVVSEREKQRLQIIEAVRMGRVPGWERIQTHLATPEPRYSDEWNIVGWQEEILPFGHADNPTLGRTWTPLTDVQNGVTSEYP